MPIRVLAPEVASKIAAGEVVERPASVVKELVENAIDAGATEIKVEVRQGGRRLIRVIDNGCGIPADEVELAFERHATSKLSTADDLSHIETLGFRGEALPSIAAVSQVTLVTRAAGEEAGTLLRLEEGTISHRQRRGAPPGTVVTAENLFYNMPARLKFLRTVATEGRHVTALVTRYAMARPHLRFTLVSDGRMVFQSIGSGNLMDVLITLYGLEVAKQLIPVGQEIAEVAGQMEEASGTSPAPTVSGFVSPPSVHRGDRKHLTFFVNGRWIQDRSLSYAVSEAYRTLMPTGRHPIVVLNLTLDPSQVDVNVHPAKAEVRFRDGRSVFGAVQRTVRRALVDHSPIPSVSGLVHRGAWDWERQQALVQAGRRTRPRRGELAFDIQRTGEVPQVDIGQQPAAVYQASAGIPVLRVIGQVAQAYIIAEGPDGLYLIDQHAAHERVLYEQLRAQKSGATAASQALLEPLTLELSVQQAALMGKHLEDLTALGFVIEPFGGQTYLVRAMPEVLKGMDPRSALLGLLDDLVDGGTALQDEEDSQLIASVCKQSAVKAGQTLSHEEMRELVRQLEETAMPRTCPHGRPTMIHLSQAQLEREFGRR